MEPLGFAADFKSRAFSDAYISVRLGRHAWSESGHQDQTAGRNQEDVSRFPVHLIIVTKSEFFFAQALRWGRDCTALDEAESSSRESRPSSTLDNKDTTSSAPAAATASTSSSTPSPPGCPELVLPIEAREHEAAAVAVVAALYGETGLLEDLPQPQLVQAVVYADRLGISKGASQALELLLAAAGSNGGLSAAAVEELGVIPAWPSCLLPLLPEMAKGAVYPPPISSSSLQKALVGALGDLEAVWRDEELKGLLLQLPLPAMQLLLSSDQLLVASEDTVLYTAGQYANKRSGEEREVAAAALGRLVRSPQLSQFQLLLQAEEPFEVLHEHKTNLRLLPSLLRVDPELEALGELQGAPEAWALGSRQLNPAAVAGGVSFVWEVSVEEPQQLCRTCMDQHRSQKITSRRSTPPLAGLGFWMEVHAGWRMEGDAGTVIFGVYFRADVAKGDDRAWGFHKIRYDLRCGLPGGAVCVQYNSKRSKPHQVGTRCGYADFLRLGPMGGDGWDEAAWVARGLPTSGTLQLGLSVLEVQ